MDTKKTSKFGLGVLIGTVIGAVTAFFITPTTGEENREMVKTKAQELKKLLEEHEVEKKVKEIFGEVTEEAKTLYLQAKEDLIVYLAELKTAISEIDIEEYKGAVAKTIKKVQKDSKKYSKQLVKLEAQLMKEWDKIKQ